MPGSTSTGQLYIFGERDYRSEELSGYYKIGIVRNARETSKRMKDHQTGNPREIIEVFSCTMPAVSQAETYLHHVFGIEWITGEWFSLNEERLEHVKNRCLKLKKEQEEIGAVLEKCEELKTTISRGNALRADNEIVALHRQVVLLHEIKIRCEARLTILKNKLIRKAGAHEGISGILKLTFKAGNGWKAKDFEKDHPELHANFLVETVSVSGIFSLHGKRKLEKVDRDLFQEKANSSIDRLSPEDIRRNSFLPRTQEIENMHLEYIELGRDIYETDWKIEQVEAKIKFCMNTASEITGVAKWPRKEKTSSKLDKKALLDAHPKIYGKYSFEKPETIAYEVTKYRRY